MADQLATAADLRTLLEEDATTLTDAQADLLVEIATGEVQAAAGQRLVDVVDDVVQIMGTTESWLDLPQRPVTTVSSVAIDGETVTDYQRHGARLWRADGWSDYVYQPSTVAVTYSHGYATGAQQLQLAKKLTLRLAAHLRSNPNGATGFSIDDYREQYSQSSGETAGDLLPRRTQLLLRRTYGATVGLARVG